ncbi:metallophosphoesterase family protein [Intestinimonas butyriciproducens]|uniref:metallophosphoesterase family protein n=1 Tax=Intestinimonas butyriciproducens TaxID=1297617 RepID=UPI0024324E4C|nr:metallophosphoesterase [Intestinimonas butyriciproducens]MCI6363090.1 metallophosphoesterase [Intestinimonas butyriciproducens]MDY3615837.1 metallophosphoesterase [Intestinimonas butyriciproducens]
MKIVVFSDSHGAVSNMEDVMRREHPELVLHLGDLCRDIEEIQRRFPQQTIQNVCGNCDGFTETPDQRILRVEGKRILMMHGHRYNVKLTYASAAYAAREAEADILLFGHTHIPYCEQVDGLWMLNPGSCGGRGATYGVISLENGEVMCYTVGIALER